MDRKSSRQKLSDTVAAKLRAQLIAGDFEVAQKLPNVEDLSQQFGVGRSTMREAIRTLEAAGYLRSAHGVGVFVESTQPIAGIGLDAALTGGVTMNDLFEARLAVESKTAELAARKAAEDHCQRMAEILDQAAMNDTNTEEFVRLDGAFHRLIAEASGNPLLVHMWDMLSSEFEDYSHKVIQIAGRREIAQDGHERILAAIIDRDPIAASELAREHIRSVQRELREAATILSNASE